MALLSLFVALSVAVAQQTNSLTSFTDGGKIAEFKIQAEQGEANAQTQVGCCYLIGQDVPLDYTEAVKWFRKAAEQGNAAAENNLGYCYANGHGVTNNPIEASKWYRKAAEQGLAIAQRNLANNYLVGLGFETNYDEAAKWYRKAAEQGDVEAQISLGSMYFSGHGVPQDQAAAVKWYREAAEQGDLGARIDLGSMYFCGQGVTQDHAEAVKWYLKAAQQGDSYAQEMIGSAYENGDGVAQNYSEAGKWYLRSAQQGDLLAQNALANFFHNGTGVPKNNIEEYKWLNLVSAQGGSSENKGINELERKMAENCAHMRDSMVELGLITPEEVAEAQRLSSTFVPRKETPSSNQNYSVVADAPIASGTGFFITEDGYLISNYHVVKDSTTVRVVTSAGIIGAKVIQTDAANDLALLKAEGHFTPLPIVSSRSVSLGATVVAVGFPDPGLQGFSPKFAKGEVAALAGAADDARYFQISVPVQPGNSGGALVDERGNVVGIVSAKLDAAVALAASGALPENVNYAVKSSFLLSFLESVPDVSAKLKLPNTAGEKFPDLVKDAQAATMLVLVY